MIKDWTGKVAYVALDDGRFEHRWDQEELDQFYEEWERGTPGLTIAKKVKRKPDEVFVLCLSLDREHKLPRRRGGWYGRPRQ